MPPLKEEEEEKEAAKEKGKEGKEVSGIGAEVADEHAPTLRSAAAAPTEQ
jgi:hypothetical protein